jgi:triphosphoribosyl-dephospho-CoA synthetase
MPKHELSQRGYTLAELLIEVSMREDDFYEASKNMMIILRECTDYGQRLSDEGLWERAQKQAIFLALESRTNRSLGKLDEATSTKIASGVRGLLPYQPRSTGLP